MSNAVQKYLNPVDNQTYTSHKLKYYFSQHLSITMAAYCLPSTFFFNAYFSSEINLYYITGTVSHSTEYVSVKWPRRYIIIHSFVFSRLQLAVNCHFYISLKIYFVYSKSYNEYHFLTWAHLFSLSNDYVYRRFITLSYQFVEL